MSNHEETTILIERYLDGELSGEELNDFESRVQKDEDLKQELDFHKELREGINQVSERVELKQKMDCIHSQMGVAEQGKVVPIRSKVRRTLAIAATISVIVSLSSVLIYDLGINKPAGKSAYTKLNRELKKVEQKGEAIADSLETFIEESEEEEVKRFGATAFAISSEGYLVTNYHAVKGARSIVVEVRNDSITNFKAEIVAGDESVDLAVLRIMDDRFSSFGRLPYTFTDSEALLGEKMFTLGYPRDDVVYGEGSISAVTGFEEDTFAYQVSIPVNPGNSGAPLINEGGEVSGIITAKHSTADGASFAIKSKYFLQYMDSLDQDTTVAPIKLPTKNTIRRKKRTDQLKELKNYVFIVKITY